MIQLLAAVLAALSMNSLILPVRCLHPCGRRAAAFFVGPGRAGDGFLAGTSSPPLPRATAATTGSSPGRRNRATVVRARPTSDAADEDAAAGDDAPWQNPRSLVGSLLGGTAARAARTLLSADAADRDARDATMEDALDAAMARASSTLRGGIGDGGGVFTDDDSESKSGDAATTPAIENVLDATILRAASVLDGSGGGAADDDDVSRPTSAGETSTAATPPEPERRRRDQRTYLGNPGVTPTALAHALWRSAVLPHRDTVIDATCGNGKDCLALAGMLFPDDASENGAEGGGDDADGEEASSSPIAPQLIGIDVQSRAVRNTKRSLLSSLPTEVYCDHVAVLERSHERLMGVPRDARSVGLVCYNLGYLPGAPSPGRPDIPSDYKECQTQTETTLRSITDAALLLRVGGLLSVMTYPGSNMEESVVVERFAEGLAMMTTRDAGGWRGYADGIPDDGDGGGGRVRALVTRALGRVADEGPGEQTWRAFVHRPLGRPLSPVLVTATRIK